MNVRSRKPAAAAGAACAVALILLTAAVSPPHAQDSAAPASSSPTAPAGYHTSRFLVPMRDGVRLDTLVLAPNDATHSYPIMLVRTPYNPAAKWVNIEPEFLSARYIFVTQSVRGRYGSEGVFVQMRPQQDIKRTRADVDESSDAFDTIDWLVKNIPRNNGRVGLRGISYNGFYAAAGMIDAHPALKAVSPQAPQADWFAGDDAHHNGAFLLASTFAWLASCDRRSTGSRICGPPFVPFTPDGYRFFLDMGPLGNADARYLHGDSPEWEVTMQHGTYDALWQRRNLLPHLHDTRPALLAVSGWYDANNLYGALHVFDAVRRGSPGTISTLVLGPWTHGEWAADGGESIRSRHFGSATSTQFIRDIELPFFEFYLKGNGAPKLPVAQVFDTGRDVWHSFDAWPPKAAVTRQLYLHSRHRLSFEPPASGESPASYDEYVSDPARPVPFVPDHGFDMDDDYMIRDQRFAANRPDVLIYQTEPLTDDVTVIGPIESHLVVSSSGTDSDWVVKLIDVHPTQARRRAEDGRGIHPESRPEDLGGFLELVRGDVMRAKFRNSLSAPEPLQPDLPTKIDFSMPDVYHTFKKGHRILVQVQSSWFPLIDLNPQRFVNIYAATAGDFDKATQRVFHAPNQESRLDLLVLPDEPIEH